MKPFFAFVLLAALLPASALAAPTDPFLAMPGRSLGRIHLGLRGSADLKRLPHPDGGYTSRHGQIYAAWKCKTSSDTLAVISFDRSYSEVPRPGIMVWEIRATSPRFHTQSGLAPGATLAEIQRHSPKGAFLRASTLHGEGPDEYYQITGKGLGFEFPAHPTVSTRSIAVSVVTPDDEPSLSAQDVQGFLEK